MNDISCEFKYLHHFQDSLSFGVNASISVCRNHCSLTGLQRSETNVTIIVSQKKILRIMNFKGPNSHTEPLFAQLQFLKIRDMHELQLLSFVYDCQNHLAPTHFHSYFTPS